MTEYRVTWTIDIDADTPRDAARQARTFQLDPTSTATVFQVDGGADIDLGNEPAPAPDSIEGFRVYTATITDKHETSVRVFTRYESALADVYAYVSERWDSVAGYETDEFNGAETLPDEVPSDQEDAVRLYFLANTADWYSIDADLIKK